MLTPETTVIQLRLCEALDECCPRVMTSPDVLYVCHMIRAEEAIRFAIRRARDANLSQSDVLQLALRLMKEVT